MNNPQPKRRAMSEENIATYEAGEYIVTAALWPNVMGYGTYGIWIQERETGKFHLLRSEKYNQKSVQEVAKAIAHLLNIKEANYEPEWFKRYMT